MSQHPTDFIYVDVAFGGASNRNNIIKADFLNDYAKKWRAQSRKKFIECYTTYFQYSDELLDHVKKTGSVRRFNGSCWANFFPLDVDDSADLEKSLNGTRAIVTKLRDDCEIDPKNLRIYFSGAKGFHIEIPGKLFGGFTPSPGLHEEFRALAKLISEDIDLVIYDKVRLWRLKNTINSKSGLYKIPLTVDELFDRTIEQIKEMAKGPRREGIFFDPNMSVSHPLRVFMSKLGKVL